jgi:hypothetical protein
MCSTTYQERGADIPHDLENPLRRALASDPKRRPACGSILRTASFNSDQLQLMRDIGELQLKPAVECLDMFKTLKEKIDVISTAACSFKILPSIGHSLKLAAGDFSNRDARETCRQVGRSHAVTSHYYHGIIPIYKHGCLWIWCSICMYTYEACMV